MAYRQEMIEQVLVALRRIIRAIDVHSRYLMQRYGLTGPQLTILQEIVRLKEIPIGELAKGVSLSHATVTDILGRLEKRGFVQRIRSQTDRRRMMVSATDAGAKVVQNTPPLLQETFIVAFAGLEDWEQTLILSSLQRVASMMEAKEVDVSPFLASGLLSAVEEETPDSLEAEEPSHQGRHAQW